MKFLSSVESLSNVETAVIVMFISYLALPVHLPDMVTKVIDSPMGTIGLFVLSVYLFFYANPLVAVLFVLVAYELFRRSNNATGKAAMIKYTPTQARKDEKMKKMKNTLILKNLQTKRSISIQKILKMKWKPINLMKR